MIAAFYVIKSGYQVALLAPTELLAKQHYKFFYELFKKENISLKYYWPHQQIKKKLKNLLLKNKIDFL